MLIIVIFMCEARGEYITMGKYNIELCCSCYVHVQLCSLILVACIFLVYSIGFITIYHVVFIPFHLSREYTTIEGWDKYNIDYIVVSIWNEY